MHPLHMDDPPWDIFGLPRLLVNEESIDRFLKMVADEHNCLTLCSGSLNADPSNNVAGIVRKHCDRIAFAHIRNVKHFENGDFSEASHRDRDGDTGILDILKVYHDCGYEGYIRPDHGRHFKFYAVARNSLCGNGNPLQRNSARIFGICAEPYSPLQYGKIYTRRRYQGAR